MASVVTLLDPKTGRTGNITPDNITRALQDGYQITSPVDVYDKDSGRTGTVAPENLSKALSDGLVPVGSHAHQVATTGYGESLARGAAQGASFGFADEITGALESLFTDKTYQQARDESRANYDVAREANPKTSVAGELGGGLASALVPVPGLGLAKGASLAKEALLGAKLGGLSGLGNSTADLTKGEVGQALQDTEHGAMLGGGLGAAAGLGTRAIGAGVKGVGRVVTEAIDPTTQRLLALGATKKNFMGPLGDKSAKAVEVFKREGLFEKLADGSEPELDDIARIAETKRMEAADKLGQLFQAAGGKRIPLNDLDNSLRTEFDKVIQDAPPDLRGSIGKSAENFLDDLYGTGGDLQKLWELKKRSGGWAGRAWEMAGQSPPLKELFMKANRTLDDALEVETSRFAQQHGLPRMSELNDTYGAMATLGKVMENKLAQGTTKDPLNTRLRDASIFSVAGGALGGAVGGGVGGAVGAAAGGMLGQSLSSTSGRLMRARIGEALHVGQQQQAVVQGAMPRSVQGAQQFLTQNFQRLAQAFPQFAQQMQQVIQAPPTQAEMILRAAMPVLQPLLAPSPFATELDGKVSSEQDKMLATKMLAQQKLLPSELAHAQSQLNKDGTLYPGIWAPNAPGAKSSDPIADEIEAFNERLQHMGY